MKTQMKTFAMMVGLLAMSAMMVMAQRPGGQGGQGGQGGPGGQGQRDALAGLKRAINQANAPVLTATQETALNALITAYRDALPDGPSDAMEAAHDAYQAALLAGNQTAANTAADIIARLQAEASAARLKASAKFTLEVLANLRAGGQLAPLNEKFTAERVLNIVRSLAGRGGRQGNRD